MNMLFSEQEKGDVKLKKKNNSKRRFAGVFLLIMKVVFILTAILSVNAAVDDYFLYVNWNPNIGDTTGVQGYVDTNGDPEDKYIVFVGGPIREIV